MGIFDKFKKKNKVEKKKDYEESTVFEVENNGPKVKKEENSGITKIQTKKKPVVKKSFSNKILIKPLISEKATVAEQYGAYAFVVNKKANKFQIKEAIREVYGVNPKKVRVLNVEGKRTSRGRELGKRADWKKAFVTLPKGKIINIHEGV